MTELEQLKHRLEMIKEDINVIINTINNNPCLKGALEHEKTPYHDSLMDSINNIDIASNLNNDESLTWKPYVKKFEGFITPDDIIKHIKIENWVCSMNNMPENIEWTNPKYPYITILATPCCTVDGEVPVEIQGIDGNAKYVLSFTLSINDFDQQIREYKETLEFVIKSQGYK